MNHSLKRKIASLLIVTILMLSLSGFAQGVEELGSGTVKWTETDMPDGWTMVTNEGGDTLGYSKDSGVTLIQVDGYAFKDMNRNGELDVYEDWRLDSETRADDLATQIELLDEGKMAMFLSLSSVSTATELGDSITTDLNNGIRSFSVSASTVSDQVSSVNMLQEYAESLPFAIPVDLRGDIGNSLAATWPTHLGFAATFDPELVAEFSRLYSSELRDLGLTSVHHPQIDIASEPRWRRFTETFGEDPALVRDMAIASVNALQSSYDEDGNDLGWGDDSVNAQVKHFPGDGAGEGGRESHSETGKYEVYPGGQFTTHLIAFEPTLTGQLPGLTGSAAGVMTDFSIHIDADGTAIGGGDAVAASYDYYIQTELLREQYGWTGLIDSDYSVINMMYWGVEDVETYAERICLALEAGSDRIANFNDKESILAGYALYAEKYGEETMVERLHGSLVRLFVTFDNVGLFDNPYLSLEESSANVASEDKVAAGFEAQLKSLVMLKNSGNVIQAARDEKLTVYIPMKYTAAVTSRWGGTTPAAWALPIDEAVASEYFNIVTDTVSETLTGEADEDGNPTVSLDDIVRASAEDVAECDFALAIIASPDNVYATIEGVMFTGQGYDGSIEEYIPLSLQYTTYTADSEYVRQESLGGDMIPGETDYYGQAGVATKEKPFVLWQHG